MLTVGVAVTLTVATAVAVQVPFAPVNVYVVLVAGLTEIVDPVEPPGLQV
jgi:hypothetical protein